MRKGSENKHISGAEKILSASKISENIDSLIKRALYHSKGESDFINIKIEKIEEKEISYVESLPVRTIEVSTAEEGREAVRSLLNQLNIKNVTAIMNLFKETYDMRGAMLLDADTLERLEPDKKRGVRATYMDSDANLNYDLDYNSWSDSLDSFSSSVSSNSKNHFQEAIVLASKVINAPNVIAEICVSDDPDYVTGYVAASSIGYVRITKLKESGDPNGGRIFLYRGPHENVTETIRYLEEQKVIVKNVPKISDNPDYSHSNNSSDFIFQQDSFQIQNSEDKSDSKFDFIKESLDNRKKSGLYREMICIDSTNCSHVTVRNSKKNVAENLNEDNLDVFSNNRNLLMLASNAYLGLINDSRVIEAAKNALAKYGTGSGGSRLTTGNFILHEELEAKLAHFKKTESALIFNTGYMANIGILSALGKKNTLIFSDELNHASIIDGCRLSHAQTVIYRHNDMKDLEEKIRIFSPFRGIIVTDAVFSMDGDIANLPKILELSKKYNLISMIDEAHATGVIGETGRGITEYFNLHSSKNPHEYSDYSDFSDSLSYPDLLMGTLSKALAAEGGFVCGKKFLIDYLRNEARSFIFSTSLAPSTIAAAKEALSILESEHERVRKLRRNVKIFVETLQKYGVNATTESAIVPIIIGDEKKAVDIAQKLFDEGIFISAIRYPSVKKGEARLRATIISEHKEEELKNAAEKIGEILQSSL